MVCTGTYQYVLVCTGTYHSYFQCYSGSEGLWCVQDAIVVIPPYPYSIKEDIDDVPFEDCWYARPQLFFQCHLRLQRARGQHLAVELWQWQTTLGGLIVEETAMQKKTVKRDQAKRSAETRRRRREDEA